MIGVEESKFSIIERLVERIQMTDVFDEIVLFSRLVGAANLGIDISQSRDIRKQGDNSDGLLIEFDRLLVPLLRRPDLRQAGQSRMVSGIRNQRVRVGFVCPRHTSASEQGFPKLRLTPGD